MNMLVGVPNPLAFGRHKQVRRGTTVPLTMTFLLGSPMLFLRNRFGARCRADPQSSCGPLWLLYRNKTSARDNGRRVVRCKSWQLQMIQHHQEFTENQVKTSFWKLHYFASSLVETWVFTYWLLRPGMSLTFRFSVKKICNPKDICFNPWFQKWKMSKFWIMKRCSNHWFQTIIFLVSLEEI